MCDACTIKKFRDDTSKVTPPEVMYFHSGPLQFSYVFAILIFHHIEVEGTP
jgi:hypothetical protein